MGFHRDLTGVFMDFDGVLHVFFFYQVYSDLMVVHGDLMGFDWDI